MQPPGIQQDQVTIDIRCYGIANMVHEGEIVKAIGEFFNTIPESDRRYVYHGILLVLVQLDTDQATISEFMLMTQVAAYDTGIKLFHIQSRWLIENILKPQGELQCL